MHMLSSTSGDYTIPGLLARPKRTCYYRTVGLLTGWSANWRDSFLARIKSSIKDAKRSELRAARNLHVRSTTRGAVRRVRQSCATGNVPQAEEQLRDAIRLLDKAAGKGVIHPNAAARRKSRLAHLLASARDGGSPGGNKA